MPFFFAHRNKFPAKMLLNPRVRWPYAVVCCLYFLLTYRGFATATPIYAKLFEGLDVDLPLLTRFLIVTYGWLFPAFFVGAAALTIVKQFVLLDGRRLLITNLILIFVGAVFVPLIGVALYFPLFDLIWKLHLAK
jgi:hypothetical protein